MRKEGEAMRRIAVSGLILLMIGGGGIAWAQRPAHVLRWRERLGLTPEQAARIQELIRAYRNDIFPLQQELRAKTHALRNALEAPQPDATSVGRLLLERRALRKQIQEKNQKLRADIEAVLTPEQRQKLREWQPAPPLWRGRRWGAPRAQAGMAPGLLR
jgi:Spy/CpxP family protein refolding chaperone